MDVAATWAAGLLRGVDQELHGVDLLGRDAALLGRLLLCLVGHCDSVQATAYVNNLPTAPHGIACSRAGYMGWELSDDGYRTRVVDKEQG